MTHLSTFEQDIYNWVVNYIEVNHKFYDYKFPPCPYAKAARLNGLLSIRSYTSGSVSTFIKNNVENLLEEKKHNVCIMVFPTYVKWFFHVRWLVKKLNIKLIPQDYYLQYGMAVKTKSNFYGQPYFIVIVNKLSDVIKGHKVLLNTEYYKSWTPVHYNNVVTRRKKMYLKFRNKI
jgi:hypothetical protein